MDEELEDVNQTVFYIPYNPSNDDESTGQSLPSTPYKDRDLENGQELRSAAYRAAWDKFLNKIKETIQELHSPSVKSVVKEIKLSYPNVLPGLPYPELPVVSIINPAFGSMYLNHVTTQLEILDQIPQSTRTIKSFVTHLYPTDFPNIQAGMRSIISSYVERDDLVPQVKRKPSTAVANYDIKYLIAWYKALKESTNADALILVIVLHDFEQFDPSVMADVFYICSMHVSQIPLVFLLSLTSPSPEYLQITYPRSTLALLRVRNFNVPSGIMVLQEILLKTFFNVDFDPDVMIGPVILEYLVEYYTRFNSSIDAILTILQLAHLRHFTSEPLTALVHATPSNQILSRAESSGFLDALITRLTLPSSDSIPAMDWRSQKLSAVIAEVDRAREDFYVHAQNLRIGFGIIMCMQAFLEKQGYKGLQWSADPHKEGGLCEAMIDVLRGKLGGDIKLLGLFIKKLKPNELHGALDELLTFFDTPLLDEQDARTTITLFKSSLSGDINDNPVDQIYPDVANRLSAWAKTFLTDKLVPLEDTDLWDIWYTGASPFPAELINPSIRASLLSGLLRPYDYADDPFENASTNATSKSLWELPDTSILFKRYLDSGKMINVYDWFESFQTILETQRMELKARSDNEGTQRRTLSPRKRGKLKQLPAETEESLKRWKMEVHARFIRALHELDYLGFIKHTKRKAKADHVLRTLFDVADDGFDE